MFTAAIGGAMHRREGACGGVNGDWRHGVVGGGEGVCGVGYVRFPNRAELGRPRAASRKSMAIGGGKRKWRNAVGFAGSLAAADGELSVYRHDRRCHA